MLYVNGKKFKKLIFIGPLTFTNPPAYTAAKIAIVAVLCFAVAITILLVYIYRRKNIRRKLLGSRDNSQPTADSSFLDLTDQENENFIVSYSHY